MEESGWGAYNPIQTLVMLRKVQIDPYVQMLAPQTAASAGAGMMGIFGAGVPGAGFCLGPTKCKALADLYLNRAREWQSLTEQGQTPPAKDKSRAKIESSDVSSRETREVCSTPAKAARRLMIQSPLSPPQKRTPGVIYLRPRAREIPILPMGGSGESPHRGRIITLMRSPSNERFDISGGGWPDKVFASDHRTPDVARVLSLTRGLSLAR
jgi:hypothetical protein